MVMFADVVAGFFSLFLGPLTYLFVDPVYNTERLANRLTIVSGVSEDIPQGIIALLVMAMGIGDSSLAMFQVITSIIGGVIKYITGVVLEARRREGEDGGMAAKDATVNSDRKPSMDQSHYSI